MCKVHRKKVKNVLGNRESIRAAEISGTPIGVKLPLRARYPGVDNHVVDFIKFARSERLPVTGSHIKLCAEQAAKHCKIQSFSVSRNWLQKFIRQSPMHPSF